MWKCYKESSGNKNEKGMDPKLQFIIGLTAGLTSGLVVWLWSRHKRQQVKNLPESHPHILLETTWPEAEQPEEAVLSAFDPSNLSSGYIHAVIQNLEDCALKWNEPAAVKFVTTGKGIRPGYQIETASGNQFQTFSGSNHLQRSPERKFNPKNLTIRHYTKDDLKTMIK